MNQDFRRSVKLAVVGMSSLVLSKVAGLLLFHISGNQIFSYISDMGFGGGFFCFGFAGVLYTFPRMHASGEHVAVFLVSVMCCFLGIGVFLMGFFGPLMTPR